MIEETPSRREWLRWVVDGAVNLTKWGIVAGLTGAGGAEVGVAIDAATRKGSTDLRLESTLRRLKSCPFGVIWDTCPKDYRVMHILDVQRHKFWHTYMQENLPGMLVLFSEEPNFLVPKIDPKNTSTYKNLECYGYGIPFFDSPMNPSVYPLPQNPTLRQQVDYENERRTSQRIRDLSSLFFLGDGRVNSELGRSYAICVPSELNPISHTTKNVYFPRFTFEKREDNSNGPLLIHAGIYMDVPDNVYNPVGFIKKK